MMRVSKVLGSLLAVGVALVAVTATAGDEELVNVSCSGGAVSVKPSDKAKNDGWHLNDKAPFKWDKGDKVSVDQHEAKFKGAKCEGTVKAFACKGDQCKGPIAVAVK